MFHCCYMLAFYIKLNKIIVVTFDLEDTKNTLVLC